MSESLVKDLVAIGVVRRGEFKLKSGQTSNIYVDFRRVISHADVFVDVCRQLSRFILERDVALVGVPTAGVPFAAVIAVMLKLPLLTIRSSPKEHGLKNMIEGDNRGRDLVMIEDIVTTGDSIRQTAKLLESQGKRIRKVIAIVDRRPTFTHFLPYPFKALFNINTLLKFTNKSSMKAIDDIKIMIPLKTIVETPHEQPMRSVVVKNGVTKELLRIVKDKQSNLIASVDLQMPDDILAMMDMVGPYVCAIKLHWDIINFENHKWSTFIDSLTKLKALHGFLLIEDRKFADIGAIVGLQMDMLPRCFDIVTTHCIAGDESMAELDKRGVGLLLVCQLSAANNLIDTNYSVKAAAMMAKHKNVVGAVAQKQQSDYLTFCPGINLAQTTDAAGQTYRQPTQGSGDIFIVGRGILQSKNPAQTAKEYQKKCWTLFPNHLHLLDHDVVSSKL